MSHFSVLVVGEDVEYLLEPYSEHLEIENIITKEDIIASAKLNLEHYKSIDAEYGDNPEAYKAKYADNASHLEFVDNEMQDMIHRWNDEDWHKHGIQYYNDEDIDDDGNATSYYNPKSKWDWYQIGGRWSDEIKVKPNSDSGTKGERSWTLDGVDEKRGYSDSALKKDIDWEHESMKSIDVFAFLSKDGWAEEGEMGWFGTSVTTDENWEDTLRKLVDSIGDDERITIVDCHI